MILFLTIWIQTIHSLLIFLQNDTKKLESGFLQITNGNQSFHYVFVESQKKSPNTPLLMWMNGGPGCSSMMGLLSEIGPYVFLRDGEMNLSSNPFSWNKEAHLLFIESPSDVGYSKNPQNLTFNDSQVAHDNFAALQEFFSNYPSYQKNPFWIAGESYAGVYIPMLAQLIDNFNAKGLALINLKGMLIGNGVTNLTQLVYSQLDYQKKHQLIPPNTNIDVCQNDKSTECRALLYILRNITKHVNPYNIYGYCWYENSNLYQNASQIAYFMQFITKDDLHIPCCHIANIQKYMNDPEVKKSLNVEQNKTWVLCDPNIKYTSDNEIAIKTIQYLVETERYQIVLYNGDNDSVVPWSDTLRSLQRLNLQIEEEWRSYYVKDNQLGGFTQTYNKGLQFVTIRGSGHMTPQDDRETAFHIFNSTIYKQKL